MTVITVVNLPNSVCISVREALAGQTLVTLRACSFHLDIEKPHILIQAHFKGPRSKEDLEQISFAETEVMARFLRSIEESKNDVEIVPPGEKLNFLPTGIAYLADGAAGTLSSWDISMVSGDFSAVPAHVLGAQAARTVTNPH